MPSLNTVATQEVMENIFIQKSPSLDWLHKKPNGKQTQMDDKTSTQHAHSTHYGSDKET